MPLDGNGLYQLPSPQFPAIPGTIIYSDDYNDILVDIQETLSLAVYRDGQAEFLAMLDAGGFGLSNVGTIAAQVGAANFTGQWNFALSPTGPTPANGDDSLKLATTEFVNNVAFNDQLPAQTGNAGKWLQTDGTNASWEFMPGFTGAAITGDVTLTATSPAVMVVTPTAFGMYATLPDATTIEEHVDNFSFYNAGEYPYGIKNSAGTILGWVYAKTGGSVGLVDNAAAAGVWALKGISRVSVTAAYSNVTVSAMSSNAANLQAIQVDANRTAILFGGATAYIIMYDKSTRTWGTATLVRASLATNITGFRGILTSANQLLVVSFSATTAMEAVTVTLSGTTVTVNNGTKATATIANTFSSMGSLVLVGTSVVVPYGHGSNTAAVRAIGISGTTPTIGASSTVQSSSDTCPVLFVAGSVVRAASRNATAIVVFPYTVSGSTLSSGTSATTTATAQWARFGQNSLGDITFMYTNTTSYVGVSRLTGTVEVISAVNTTTGAIASTQLQVSDMIQIGSGKTLLVFLPSGPNSHFVLMTDTAGVATINTITVDVSSGTPQGVAGILVSGTSARIALKYNTNSSIYTIDCSTATPAVSASNFLSSGTASISSYPASSTAENAKDPGILYSGEYFRIVKAGMEQPHDLSGGLNTVALMPPANVISNLTSTNGANGANSRESWVGVNHQTTVGFSIQLVELAA